MKFKTKFFTPYSGVHETGDNTPSLKHFFRCLNTGTSLVDSKGGVVWTPTAHALIYNTVLNSYSTTMTSNSLPELATGSFHNFSGSKTMLATYAARVIDGIEVRLAIGDNNKLLTPTNGSGIGLVSTHAAVADTANLFALQSYYAKKMGNVDDAFTINVQGMDIFVVFIYVPGSGVYKHAYYNLSTGAELQSGDNTGDLTLGDFQPYSAMRFSGLNLYMAAYYEFTTLPADWLTGCLWMASNAKNGNRYSYPRWMGIT